MHLNALALTLCALLSLSYAQFNFFENIFQQQGQPFQQQQQQQPQRPQAPSDSSWYQGVWLDTFCDNYLCPGTLSCVSVPHHCPCAFPLAEDKVELGEGSAICGSKGGYKQGELARKVELARKGVL